NSMGCLCEGEFQGWVQALFSIAGVAFERLTGKWGFGYLCPYETLDPQLFALSLALSGNQCRHDPHGIDGFGLPDRRTDPCTGHNGDPWEPAPSGCGSRLATGRRTATV